MPDTSAPHLPDGTTSLPDDTTPLPGDTAQQPVDTAQQPAVTAQQPCDALRVLIDTSVLAPEPLWLWMLALTDGVRDTARPILGVSRGVTRELRHALRRIDPQLTRAQADRAARLRTGSLTRIDDGSAAPTVSQSADEAASRPVRPTTPQPARPHVLDPDDAHLDAAALAWGADVLVTDDVHAFAPLPAAEQGYALLTADEFLCMLVDTHSLSVAEALPRYQHRLAQVVEDVGAEAPSGSPSHRLRRSRAHRFARRVVRAQRAVADSTDSLRRAAG